MLVVLYCGPEDSDESRLRVAAALGEMAQRFEEVEVIVCVPSEARANIGQGKGKVHSQISARDKRG